MKGLTKMLMVLVVGVLIAGVIVRVMDGGDDGGGGKDVALSDATPIPPEPLNVSVVAALPVEPWVRSAARTYNADGHFVSGSQVLVEVIPQEGLPALEKWANGTFDPIPTAWLAESRTWVDQANTAVLEAGGTQDIFLAGGQYRAQPVVLSPLVWAIWEDVLSNLMADTGAANLSWNQLHDAGESGDLGLLIGDPKRDPAGIIALANAASEYFDKPTIKTADLDPAFYEWLGELLDAAVFSHFGIEDMLLFGPPGGDVGLGVESFLLPSLEVLQQRDPALTIVYPEPIAWFDFPYAIYMGKETTAEEKQAALDFKEFLLSADQQSAALEFGLRPACVECSSNGGLIAELRNQGVLTTITNARMRPPSRQVLDALTQWYRAYAE